MMRMFLLVCLTACSASVSLEPTASVLEAVSDDPLCAVTTDDTALVTSAMQSATCLPDGTYHIAMAPLGPTGRRRDAMLAGGTLCGVRSSTTIMFHGDASGMFWAGVLDASVNNVKLDTHCVFNTPEQAHLIRLTTNGHVIRDVELVHPKRSPSAGDDINIVGSLTTPIQGLVIDNVKFTSCARFGVQISRGVTNGVISNSDFGDGCAFGSEGAGGIDGLRIEHSRFVSTTPGLALNIQRQTNTVVSHVELHGRTILLYFCDGCRVEHSTVSDLIQVTPGDYVGAVTIANSAHNVTLTDLTLTQSSPLAASLVRITPLRTNMQADLANILITDSTLTQSTQAPLVVARGVTGVTIQNSNLTYNGVTTYVPVVLDAAASVATTPAVSVPTTGIVLSNNTTVGIP